MPFTCPKNQFCFNRQSFIIIVIFLVGLVVYLLDANNITNILGADNFTSGNSKDMQWSSGASLDNAFDNSINDDKGGRFNESIQIRREVPPPPRVTYVQEPVTQVISKPIVRDRVVYNSNYSGDYSGNYSNNNGYNQVDRYNEINNTRLNEYPTNSVPINIPTRGYNTSFNQIGILHSINKNMISNNIILPLYGKQMYPGSTKWKYYTSTDGYNSLKIPIFFKNKKCISEHGCEEIGDGDIVRVPAYKSRFRVSMYENSAPTYIPYV